MTLLPAILHKVSGKGDSNTVASGRVPVARLARPTRMAEACC